MDVAAHIVGMLADLGFSFWQLLILCLILMFKQQISALIAQVQQIKFGGSEISMRSGPSSEAQALQKIKELKNDLEQASEDANEPRRSGGDGQGSTSAGLSEVKRKLDLYLQESVIKAVKQIRDNTSFLWPEMRTATPNVRRSARIRLSTYNRIYDDLQILKSAGLIDFHIGGEGQYTRSDAVLELVFKITGPEIQAMIAQIDAG